MTLFKKPEPAKGITIMVRGEPGSGKTRFGLGAKKATNLPVAYCGNDRGAKFYQNDPEIGGFLAVETSDVAVIDAAIAELEADAGKTFGAVVLDTVTNLWDAEQSLFEKVGRDGVKSIPMRSWRPLREGHETRLRRIQNLPVHVILVCEEKPVYERDGDELREVGSREDADKRDAYACDVRLRFFVQDGKFKAEVLKDRTGRFPMGATVENPRIEMWVTGAAAKPTVKVASADETVEKAALEMIDAIGEISNGNHWRNWRKKHAQGLAELLKALPEGDTKRKLITIGQAKKAEFEGEASS